MTIDQIQDEVVEEFSAFDDWMDKYALLIELGNSLPRLTNATKPKTTLSKVVRAGCGCMPSATVAAYTSRPKATP